MRSNYLNSLLPAILLATASCSSDTLVDLDSETGKLRSRFNPGQKPTALDFERDCGISQAKMDDKNALLLSGNYTSFPILVQGEAPMIGPFWTILQAKVTITANSSGSKITQNVASIKSSNFAVKAFADGDAKKASGFTESTALPTAEWLVMSGPNGNPEMRDLLCVITGARGIRVDRGEGLLTATFSPALVSSVSPLAPVERMRKEIGSGRTFRVTANVTAVPRRASTGTFKTGTQSGTITIREIKPSLQIVNDEMDINQTITADIAYEVINDFPGGAYSVGLAKRTVFLIDTTNKQFRAILTEDDRPASALTKAVIPPIVIVKDR